MKEYKKDLTYLKKIIKTTNDSEILKDAMDILYERITNREDKDYNKKYNLSKILTNKTTTILSKEYKNNVYVIIEIVKYDTAPSKYVLIYNKFTDKKQTELEIYV